MTDFLPDVALHQATVYLPNWLASVLCRRDHEIEVPDIKTVRPLVWACRGGHNNTLDRNPAWRSLFGSHDREAQNLIRGIWQEVRGERTAEMADALAVHIVELFQACADQQAERLAKREQRSAPKAASIVLEHARPLLDALTEFDLATRGAGGSQWTSLAQGLVAVEAAAKREMEK